MKNLFVNKNLILLFILVVLGGIFFLTRSKSYVLNTSYPPKQHLPTMRSIDTMKYSRDIAREKLNDQNFDPVIERQIKQIAETGATHIALGTPYDSEFLPYLKKWAGLARKYHLKVWFRGNLAGWEGWFNYPKIDRSTHTRMVQEFILKNPDLFEDGDIFTPCNECENGGPGDPRHGGDLLSYRGFLISEYNTSRDAFLSINKKVAANYFSMNGDVARLVMDKDTTKALGGVVVIDHYVSSADKLAADIKQISEDSGGDVVLGEFGAPIPDIHGQMSEEQQADWIKQALAKIFPLKELIGVNYWVSVGGTTELWNSEGKSKKAVSIIQKYYKTQ